MSRLRKISLILGLAPGLFSCGVAESIKKPLEETTNDGEARVGSVEKPVEVFDVLNAVFLVSGSQTKQTLKASWLDGLGTFKPGNTGGASTLSRSDPQGSTRGVRGFQLTLGKETYTEALRLDECDFVRDLGYDPHLFSEMTIYFSIVPLASAPSFESRPANAGNLNRLVRMEYGSGEDPKAVSCGKARTKSGRTIEVEIRSTAGQTVKLSEMSSGDKGSKTLTPELIRLSSVTQVNYQEVYSFSFDTIKGASDARKNLSLKGALGSKDLEISFDRCLASFPKMAADLSFTRIRMSVNAQSEVETSPSLHCCYQSGSCQSAE